MEKIKVFVDGQAGTTGLKINQRLANHPFVEIIQIDQGQRKNPQTRQAMINEADVVFLCLPDQASKEAASMVEPDNRRTRLLDASTAHRVNPDWVYGLPELSPQARLQIQNSRRIAVPGCHATAFILPLYPLLQAGLLPRDYPVASHSITGYSGGGKQMIAQYQSPQRQQLYGDYDAPREYALNQGHKHLPEMQKITGLTYPPAFSPIVGDFQQGLAVFTPLATRLLPKQAKPADLQALLAEYYKDQTFVKVMPLVLDQCDGSNFFNAKACNQTNLAEIFVFGNADQCLLVCRLDNLGKGASGAAIQNMNLMCGFPEETGLL